MAKHVNPYKINLLNMKPVKDGYISSGWEFKNVPLLNAYNRLLHDLELQSIFQSIGDSLSFEEWLDDKLKQFPQNRKFARSNLWYILWQSKDYHLIREFQLKAFQKRLSDGLEVLKLGFKSSYSINLIPEKFLNEEIQRVQGILDQIDEKQIIHNTELVTAGHISSYLSAYQAKSYLAFSLKKELEELGSESFEWDKLDYELKEHTVYSYIVHYTFLKWLQWLKKQEAKNTDEPSIRILSDEKVKDIVFEQKRVKQQVSYTWLNNPNTELPKLYQYLKDNALIDNNTSLEQIKAVFTAKPLHGVQPINWIGAKNLLTYFLDSIRNNKKIPPNTHLWSIADKCFVDAKDLIKSRNYERVNQNGKPKGFEIVDEIINTL